MSYKVRGLVKCGSNVFLPCISDDWVYLKINDKQKFKM